ncbi:MAG: hypothetical protein LJE92_08210, partial [Gammaproteobacteria bacterium]|nr:hypothetical protein [Gammaproteobacteria bacterium]
MLQRLALIIGILAFTVSCGQAPDSDSTSLWRSVNPPAVIQGTPAINRAAAHSRAEAYFSNDSPALRRLLRDAPQEISGDPSQIISLPLPDGSQARFSIIESPVMAPALAAKFPELKTYKVYGLDDTSASGRVDISPRGFRGLLNTARGRVTIDPTGDLYHVRYRSGGDSGADFQCRTGELDAGAGVESNTALRTILDLGSEQTSDPLVAGRSAVAQRISNNYLVYRL